MEGSIQLLALIVICFRINEKLPKIESVNKIMDITIYTYMYFNNIYKVQIRNPNEHKPKRVLIKIIGIIL